MSNVHRFPVIPRLRTVREQIVASLAETEPPYGTADIVGLPDDLTPSDLADMADTIDCVGVFDADRRSPGSGDCREDCDDAARRHVEGYRQPGLKP